MKFASRPKDEEKMSPKPLILRSFVGSLVISFLVMYQVQIKTMWNELPQAAAGDLETTQVRLAAVTKFIDSHPFWIGSYTESGERSRLNAEVVQLRTAKTVVDSQEGSDLVNRRLEAESARARAGQLVLREEYEGARDSLLHALEVAPEDWDQAGQVKKDLAAIEQELEVNG